MKICLLLLISFLLALLSSCTSDDMLKNLDTAKSLVREYYESGKYDAECKEIIDNAISRINRLPVDNNSAVIFDVDDTALSGYDYTKSLGFGYVHSSWREWMDSCKMKAIPQVKRFYDWLLLQNIKIFFLTGRKADTYNSTKKNLIHEGFTKFDTLIVRNEKENSLPAAEYKSNKRKELTERGYHIIANIGDQENDLSGNYSGIKIKLPNYLYLVD